MLEPITTEALPMPVHELQPWALRAFEAAYETTNRRAKCSRADFWAGYRAALIALHAISQFRNLPQP
jgi:hypothetical protein